jgi:dTDP-4-dehydrorhamnose reductase
VSHVVVFGSGGQLAQELKRTAWGAGTEVTSLGRDEADFRDLQSLANAVRGTNPDAVIIAAAYTAVDKAESEEALAFAINAEAPGVIAAAAAEAEAPVIYISTDYVFDGEKPGWYTEDDAPGPLNAYGRSKLAGEEKVRENNPRHLILRTSWLYSAFGTNFVRTMVKLAEARDRIEVVADQRGCPTTAGDLAGAIARLVRQLLGPSPSYGTYHLAGAADATWHGFAEAVFEALAARGMARPQNIAIDRASYPGAARRPLNSRLSSDRMRDECGVSLPPWQESLPGVLREILCR